MSNMPGRCLARRGVLLEARSQRCKAAGHSGGAYLCVGQPKGQVPQGSRGRQQRLQLRVHLLSVQLHLQVAAVCAAAGHNVSSWNQPAHQQASV